MKKVKLNKKQIDRLSEYFANLSLLILGTIVVPQFISVSKLSLINLIFGIIGTVLFIIISLILLK